MKPFRIISLEAHQIGPFGDFKMTFPEKPAGMEDKAEVHILTGENGTGKSTILELLVGSLSKNSNSPKFRKNVNANSFTVEFSKYSKKYTSSFFYPRNENQIGQFNSEIAFEIQRGDGNVNPYNTAAFAYSGHRRFEKAEIYTIQEITSLPFEDALDFQNSINPTIILQWIANNIAKEAISKNQNDEISAKRYRMAISQLEQAISKIIEQPIHFVFEFNPTGISIEVNHERTDFNLLPDGLKSIISWLADLLMRMDRVKWVNDTPVFERNFILFLDEIEVHMHPKWQRKILPAVQGLFPNAQIFISTHSPFVINSVDGAWIHRLVKPNGDSVAEEPILSEDGKSVTHILEEIFGIKERFGESVEQDLKAFYNLRNKVLKGEEDTELLNMAKKLQGQSTELDQVVEMEIRQINRRRQLQPNN